MLVAQLADGQYFMLQGDDQRHVLKKLRHEQTFFCPQCQSPLLLKVGNIKIPHFAHQKHSSCEQAFSEGETTTHLLGKQQLFNHFQSQQLQVSLEPTIPNFSQRPDLLITCNAQRFAIEFQYSPIAHELFQARTDGYYEQHIKPIWLVNTPRAIVGAGIQKLTVTHFLQQFITHYKELPVLMTYCPYRTRFFYAHSFLHVQKNTFICVVDELPIEQQRFPFLMPKKLTFERFCNLYALQQQSVTSALRARFHYSRKGVQDLFLRYLYELRLALEELPNFLKIPVVGCEHVGEIASGWQCGLFYFAQQLQKPVWLLTKREVQLFLHYTNLPNTQQALTAFRNYMEVLKALDVRSLTQQVDDDVICNILYSQFIAK